MKPIFYACVACILMLFLSRNSFAQDFNHTPDWATSADGVLSSALTLITNGTAQIQAAYGYKTVSLGDINNDGWPDVAVSAPAMAAIGSPSSLSVGAVFIFYGTSAGIPNTTPDKVLQPTTFAGALFGFSMAVGDVTGDGVKDLIVGAPGDQVTVSSVTGTIGKVYVYDGSTLANSSPTPTLTLNLNSSLITAANISVNALFGFSVAATGDMDGDGKGEVVVGAPAYASIGAPGIKTGGAFVILSNTGNIVSLSPPSGGTLNLASTLAPIVTGVLGTILGGTVNGLLASTLNGQINGLLFGFSVDGSGDYDLDGRPDIVVGAPAGVNVGTLVSGIDLSIVGGLLSTLNSTLNGQILGGSAYVFSGNGSNSVGTSTVAQLQATSSGILSNAANLFGFAVKGVTDTAGVRNGNILVSAPTGALIPNAFTLQVKAGSVYVYVKPSSTPSSSTPITGTQTLSSPRSTTLTNTVLSLSGNLGLSYGASMDNMRDVNGDLYNDIVIGEPLSTSVGGINAQIGGGATYIYLGKSDGTYEATPLPSWTLNPTVSTTIGVNAASLVGFSVAGNARPKGTNSKSQPIVGAPGMALDFSSGVLNLGSTVSTLLSTVAGSNGLGKAYTFNAAASILPVNLISFTGKKLSTGIQLQWTTSAEINSNYFVVQRSADGASFVKIGQVGAAGNSSGRNIDYSFLDPAPLAGPNYYRLKMVDIDEAYDYSSTLLIRLDNTAGSSVIINPNPVSDKLQLSWKNMPAAEYTIDIINSGGKIVRTQKITVNSSVQTNIIPRESNWGSGLCIVNIRSASYQTSVKVLLQ